MARKQQIQRMIEKLPEDVTYERVIYHLSVMQDIEIAMDQAARGEGIEHDELFARLEAEDEKAKNLLDASRNTPTRPGSRVHRKGSAADGSHVHKTSQKARRKA